MSPGGQVREDSDGPWHHEVHRGPPTGPHSEPDGAWWAPFMHVEVGC